VTTQANRLNKIALGIRLALAIMFAAWIFFVVGGSANRVPKENSPEVTFTRDMMAHHAQAVDMAVRIREVTTDPELRTFALDLILTQQNQIGQMQAWLELWKLPQAGLSAPMGGMGEAMGMATQVQVNELSSLPPAEGEINFLQLMIRHHEGGVMMAQNVLAKTKNPVVTRLAQSIVTAQNSEISYLESLLAKRNATRLEPLQPAPMPGMNH
jgi:uncharacterized protein (DUF305 family)